MIERQIQHRFDALVLRQDFFRQPFVEGVADHDLGFDLRMHAQHQHRRWEHDHVVDAHRIHRALHQGHLGVGPAARHALGEPLLVRDAPEHILMQKARRGVDQPGRRAATILERARHLPIDVAVHAVDDFRPERGLGDMRVDVDDEVVVALLLGGMSQDLARVGLDGDFRQLADARRLFPIFAAAIVLLAVLAVGRRSLEHGYPPLKRSGRVKAVAVAPKLAEAEGFDIAESLH